MTKISKIEITEHRGWTLDGVELCGVDPGSYMDQWCSHLRDYLERVYQGAEIEVDWLDDTAPTGVEMIDVTGQDVTDEWRHDLQHDMEEAWTSLQVVD